jgi:hypothetical protein
MKNIALAIDGNACRQARVWAVKPGASVSSAVAALLENLPGRRVRCTFPRLKRT